MPWNESLMKPTGLRRTLEQQLSDAMLDELRAGHAQNRSLACASTNADFGTFRPFDLMEAAGQDNATFRTAMVERLMASSAIPAAFPPVEIGGSLYVDGGATANIWAVRDQGQPTEVRVQGSIGYVYNDYHLRTMFNRLYETYAAAGTNVVFILYSNDARLKATGNLGASVPIRGGALSTGTYSGGFNVSYQIRPSKPAVRLDGSFNIKYRQRSLTDPDPAIPLQTLFYSLYSNSPGFSTYARIGISVTFGNARKKSQDQRGPNL
ncbi:MAG: hypothetical protein EBX52_12715 [Proteobacteria bacterium]|nr:hypothetical protein [Pseudomonadota bacterium]